MAADFGKNLLFQRIEHVKGDLFVKRFRRQTKTDFRQFGIRGDGRIAGCPNEIRQPVV